MNVCFGFVISHQSICQKLFVTNTVSRSLVACLKSTLDRLIAEESQNTLKTHIINICFSPCRK